VAIQKRYEMKKSLKSDKSSLSKAKLAITAKTEEPKILLSSLKPGHLLILCLALFIAILALWQSFLPFFAELSFREGYNAGIQQNYNYAMEQMEKAVADAPWETYYQSTLGKLYEDVASKETNPNLRKSLTDKALLINKRALEIDPLNPWYHNRLASTYLLIAYDEPANTSMYLNLAENENKLASEYDQNNPIFKIALGVFYHRFNQLDKAKECYEAALKIDSNLVEANYYLSEIYKAQKQPTKVIEYYQKTYVGYNENFRKGAPDFEQSVYPIINNISLLLADYYLKNSQFKDAADILQDFIRSHPEAADEQLILLGKIYYLQKKWPRIIKIYDPLLFKYPNRKELWLIYVTAAIKSNNLKSAFDKTNFFLESHPGDFDFVNFQNYLKQHVK